MSTLARSLVRPLARSLVVDDVPLWARRLGAPSNAVRAFDWTAPDRYWNTSLKSFSRASDGWQQNASGVWVRSDPGILRRADGVGALWETNSINYYKDPTFSTVPLGAVSSPSGGNAGQLNFTNFDSVTINAKGVTDGIGWVEITATRVNSTGSVMYPRVRMATPDAVVAGIAGDKYAHSVWMNIISTTHSWLVLLEGTSSLSFPAYVTGVSSASLNTGFVGHVNVLWTQAAGASIGAYPNMGPSLPAGQTLNITYRMGMPQFEKRASASSPYPHSGSGSATRAADAGALAAAGLANWTIVFDNGSTQTFSAVNGDLSIVPANLNRSTIRGGWAVAA